MSFAIASKGTKIPQPQSSVGGFAQKKSDVKDRHRYPGKLKNISYQSEIPGP